MKITYTEQGITFSVTHAEISEVFSMLEEYVQNNEDDMFNKALEELVSILDSI